VKKTCMVICVIFSKRGNDVDTIDMPCEVDDKNVGYVNSVVSRDQWGIYV
jgi:hypothetical protein